VCVSLSLSLSNVAPNAEFDIGGGGGVAEKVVDRFFSLSSNLMIINHIAVSLLVAPFISSRPALMVADPDFPERL
jgi:hypothetical protein